MIELSEHESRVLGVLVEKQMTTPEQYPLSINAITNGSNQKNNRDPILQMTEQEAFEAVEGLRGKGLSVRVDMAGSRVSKYKHSAIEVLHVRAAELAILAELLLRGPQTLGELRGRASRMQPLESLEVVRDMLTALSAREEPLIRQLPPSPGSRAERFMQLLCPHVHPETESNTPAAPSAQPPLTHRVEKLEADVAMLRRALVDLAQKLGEPDPTSSQL